MTLNEIKSKTILKGYTMTRLAEPIGLNRRTMYLHITSQNDATIEKIQKILNL